MIRVVIPVHNRLALTRACLASLREQTFRDFVVYVVDDGSTDGTFEALRADHPEVIVLRGNGHLWWAGATNRGVGRALQEAGPSDYVLTLNNDAVAPADYLEKMVRAAAASAAAALGSVLVKASDESSVVDAGVLIDWTTAKYTFLGPGCTIGQLTEQRTGPYTVDLLCGCGTLFPVRVFRQLGLYAADKLPHYAADYEFANRVRRSGEQVLVNPEGILLVEDKETGLHGDMSRLGVAGFVRTFLSIKSAHALRYRFRFALLACPRRQLPTYLACDVARLVVGGTRRWLGRGSGAA